MRQYEAQSRSTDVEFRGEQSTLEGDGTGLDGRLELGEGLIDDNSLTPNSDFEERRSAFCPFDHFLTQAYYLAAISTRVGGEGRGRWRHNATSLTNPDFVRLERNVEVAHLTAERSAQRRMMSDLRAGFSRIADRRR